MTEHPNARLAATLVDAFSRGDLDTVAGSLSPDAVWDLPGHGAVAGTYKGPQEIVGFLAKAYEMSGGTLRLDVIDILGSDWGAVHVQHVTADHDGRHLDCVEILAHHIVDGVIVRTHHRPDQYAIDAFFRLNTPLLQAICRCRRHRRVVMTPFKSRWLSTSLTHGTGSPVTGLVRPPWS